VVCLYGDLGSGKTTFVQGFARGLGILRRLPSPTFIIVRRYEIPNTSGFLYHLDLYRIHTEKELEDLGFSEMIEEANSYMIIEWAEKLGGLLPQSRTDVKFAVQPDGNHQISIQSYDRSR
jgi:tRNA threonylcarbamoyladenosine biosynthesis protein TsaE